MYSEPELEMLDFYSFTRALLLQEVSAYISIIILFFPNNEICLNQTL